MFWGLILKTNKRYSQKVQNAFHLSSAALDTSQVKANEDIQILLNSDDNNFLLCTLNKNNPQAPLDLNFAEGDKICFSIKGDALVHLTGFLIPEDDMVAMDDDEEEDEEEVKKSQEKPQGNSKIAKILASMAAEKDESDDEEDSDDESFKLENAAPEQDSDEDGEEEEESDDDEAEEEDSDDDEEEAAPEPTKKKAKLEKSQNGVENGKGKENKQQQQQQQQKAKEAAAKSLPGGVQITELAPGKGPEARSGKKVSVYYEGRLKQNNKVFDSTKHGSGFKFALGKGNVIKGWDVGVVGMRVGGKRRIVCPPNMAYGAKGSPPVIPPNSTLVFDVELKQVH